MAVPLPQGRVPEQRAEPAAAAAEVRPLPGRSVLLAGVLERRLEGAQAAVPAPIAGGDGGIALCPAARADRPLGRSRCIGLRQRAGLGAFRPCGLGRGRSRRVFGGEPSRARTTLVLVARLLRAWAEEVQSVCGSPLLRRGPPEASLGGSQGHVRVVVARGGLGALCPRPRSSGESVCFGLVCGGRVCQELVHTRLNRVLPLPRSPCSLHPVLSTPVRPTE